MIKKVFILLTILFLSFIYCQAQTVGKASYYHNRLHGHRTSDGGKYHKDSLTCAHRTYPLGTYLQVRNPQNGETVKVWTVGNVGDGKADHYYWDSTTNNYQKLTTGDKKVTGILRDTASKGSGTGSGIGR